MPPAVVQAIPLQSSFPVPALARTTAPQEVLGDKVVEPANGLHPLLVVSPCSTPLQEVDVLSDLQDVLLPHIDDSPPAARLKCDLWRELRATLSRSEPCTLSPITPPSSPQSSGSERPGSSYDCNSQTVSGLAQLCFEWPSVGRCVAGFLTTADLLQVCSCCAKLRPRGLLSALLGAGPAPGADDDSFQQKRSCATTEIEVSPTVVWAAEEAWTANALEEHDRPSVHGAADRSERACSPAEVIDTPADDLAVVRSCRRVLHFGELEEDGDATLKVAALYPHPCEDLIPVQESSSADLCEPAGSPAHGRHSRRRGCAPQTKETKWGRCPDCARALMPVLWPQGLQNS